jgi:hypothetical protein
MGESFDLVPPELAVEAMRDNGYRNAAYALAELVDNSIQAGANQVEVLCAERVIPGAQRDRRNLWQVAVLDNGDGMTPEVLQIALQFGNGTRRGAKSGIGRFGMGLPSASISQCTRVEVWSWTSSRAEALYTYIDVDEIVDRKMREVPKPVKRPVPDMWLEASTADTRTNGTLVVWSSIDRCTWKTGLTVIKNCEFVVGRMYRKFIESGEVSIRMAAFEEGAPKAPSEDRLAVANDPNYLMLGTSTPDPYDKVAMFEPDGDTGQQTFEVKFRGDVHQVTLRFSVAKREAREGARNAGQTPYGKHAGNNIGVSVVRERRELNLDLGLVSGHDTRERWWGAEIEFPAALDDVFGVPNNKQEARNFAELTKKIPEIFDGDQSPAAVLDELDEENDPRKTLIEIVQTIDRRLQVIRGQIKVQTANAKGGEGRERHRAEKFATEVTRQRKEEGWTGESDAGESALDAERESEIAGVLLEDGIEEADAQDMAAEVVRSGIKYILTKGDVDGAAFFTVRSIAGELFVKLNVNHPVYENLVEALDEEDGGRADGSMDLRERLDRASIGLRLLLMAWARYEDEQPAQRRMDLQEIRTDWGRYARKFLPATE